MSSTLNTVLSNYEKKRNKAIREAETRKKDLYIKYPQFQKIEDEINKSAIQTNKLLLSSSDTNLINDLKSKLEKLKKERLDLYRDLNIPEDYLQPKFECGKCNDTGYITENYSTQMCTCLKQELLNAEYNKSHLINLKTQNFDTFDSTIYSNIVDNSISKKSPRENIEGIKEKCLNFINNFDDLNEKNILFTGTTGTGKTFLSSCIANELLKKGKTVLYQTAPVMLDTIIDYKFGKISDSNVCEKIFNVDLLIIDDLGTENLNNVKYTELFNVLNTRLLSYANKTTKTIISTNLDLNKLSTIYDNRILSRILGSYNIYHLFGEDLRIKTRTLK